MATKKKTAKRSKAVVRQPEPLRLQQLTAVRNRRGDSTILGLDLDGYVWWFDEDIKKWVPNTMEIG